MNSTVVRRILLVAVFVGGISALVAGKLISDAASRGAGDEKKKKKGASATLVTTYEVQPITITDTLSAVGTIRPVESIAIKNEVPGKVVRIGFEEGDRVERGDLLLEMRSEALRAELEVKERRRKLLQTQVDRQHKILEKGGISQQEFDVTKNELEVLEAEIDKIRAELARTTVRAPFDGRVGLRDVSPGAILQTGTRVAELVQTEPVEVEFSVPERYAAKISEGADVRFRVHGSSEIRSAEIHALASSLDADSRSLRVRARAPNSGGDLRPGAYADVRAKLETLEDVLAVPAPALVQSANETVVWVNDDGEARQQKVEIGVRTEGKVEITEGLSPGDVVVTTGRQTLKPGAKLKVDRSDDAMDVEEMRPDPDEPGMRNKWFSEEPLEEEPSAGDSESPDSDGDSGSESGESTESSGEREGGGEGQ